MHRAKVKKLNEYLEDVESHPREFQTVVAARRASFAHWTAAVP